MSEFATDATTAESKRRARVLWAAGSVALLLAIAVLGVTSWTAYQNWLRARAEAEITQDNRNYLRTINNVLAEVDDAETSQRGFILTGREVYLDPYRRALRPLEQNLQALRKIVPSKPDQKDSIDRLEAAVRAKGKELTETIQLRRTQGATAAMSAVLTDEGMHQMDKIRSISRSIVDSERITIAHEADVSAQHQLAAVKISAVGGALLLVLMVAGLIALTSGAKQQTLLAEGLANSRETFQTTLTSIGDGVLATDTTGKVTFINPEAARLTGWSLADAVGQPLQKIFHIVNEASQVEVESPFEKVMRTGSAVGLANHTILVRPDGSKVPIDDSGAPIKNAYGKLSGVVLVFRDIAERRKAEESLQHSHDEVLKANEELRQFSYAATHDLQEPLRTIVVFSQLLGRNCRQSLDERGQHLLKTVEEAALRMSTLIDHLLAYTRVGAVDSPMARVEVDAMDILDDTLVQLKGAIEENKAVITCGSLPRVWSEPAQLSQVFLNLISNAIKYRKPNVPPAIHVTANRTGEFATFQVSDNGIGFKQEYSDRIFLLFQRLHGRSIPGTGIGLALCRRIVERQGGKIWVNSEENKGTTFYFTLPAVQNDTQPTAV